MHDMNHPTYIMTRLLPVLLLSGSMLLCPQETAAQTSPKAAEGAADPFYLQFFGGINKSANDHLPLTEFSRYPISGGLFLGLGRECSPLWGWRVALRYNHNKGRGVEKCENPETWGWHSVSIMADATFDLTDAWHPASMSGKPQVFNLKAFAGVGVGYAFGYDDVPLSYTAPYSRSEHAVPALRAGLTATVRVAPQWRIGAELSYTAWTDRFNGVKAGFPLDGRSNLNIGISYLLGRKRTKVEPKLPVVYGHRLRTVPDLPYAVPETEGVKRRTLTGRAFLDFPVNETEIRPSYRGNPQELRRICASIDSALFDPTMQVTSISLHGYASPESPLANNTRLAKGRTAALKQFLMRRYRLPDSLFHTSHTPEDWQNLKAFVADADRRRTKGDIWYDNASVLETPMTPSAVLQHRDELLAVMALDIDLDEKEERLKQVGGGAPYRWLLAHVFPGLRHTDYVIDYVVRRYPVKQSRKLIYTHPEVLSLDEMADVAGSYERGTDEWFDAWTIAARQYPDDPTANLNAACACVQAHRLTDARLYLRHAGQTPGALYVADVIRAMEGEANWRMDHGKVVICE